MNRIDMKLFSAMQTVEIHLKLCRREPFRHMSELGKYIADRMLRLQKGGTIDKRVFRYFRESLDPQSNGFHRRWVMRLERYYEIRAVERKMEGLTDRERLTKVLDAISEDLNILVAYNITDEQKFNQEDGERVARYGFIGLSANEEASRFNEQGFITETCWLSARLPNREMIIAVFRYLQTFGFSIHDPQTTVQPKKVGFISLLSPLSQQETQKAA